MFLPLPSSTKAGAGVKHHIHSTHITLIMHSQSFALHRLDLIPRSPNTLIHVPAGTESQSRLSRQTKKRRISFMGLGPSLADVVVGKRHSHRPPERDEPNHKAKGYLL
jgi:hypothetical protein